VGQKLEPVFPPDPGRSQAGLPRLARARLAFSLVQGEVAHWSLSHVTFPGSIELPPKKPPCNQTVLLSPRRTHPARQLKGGKKGF
jgi:hypothetical protein